MFASFILMVGSRLAPSLFRGISVLRKIITSAGAYVVVYAPAEVIIFLSTDISRNRLGASLGRQGNSQGKLMQSIPLVYPSFLLNWQRTI